MRLLKKIFYSLFVLLLFSCSNHPKQNFNLESFQLQDSLFLYKNIKNSLIVNKFWYDSKHDFELYADSAKRTRFVQVDSAQKTRIILPVLLQEGFAKNYILNFMDVVFVSKQKKIGENTPIIVWINADDFGGLFYIILDKNFRPVSYFIMNGGSCGGPINETDTTITLCPVINSVIKGNEIFSYSLTETMAKSDSIKRLSVFDSVAYKSEILPSGQIVTKRIDSTRYERK